MKIYALLHSYPTIDGEETDTHYFCSKRDYDSLSKELSKIANAEGLLVNYDPANDTLELEEFDPDHLTEII